MKKREDAAAPVPQLGAPIGAANGALPAADANGISVAAPVSLEQIAAGRSYDEKIGAVRGFTRDNPARAALAVRDMIAADAKS